MSGVPDERIVELYAEAELAVVPSLYEGFSLPAIEAMASRHRRSSPPTGGALPEVVGADGETVLSCRAGDADALAATIRRGLDDPDAAGHGRRRRPPAGHRALELAHTAPSDRRAVPRAPRDAAARAAARGRDRLMLTVRYDRLGLQPGDRAARPRLRASAATPSRPPAAAPASSPSTTTTPS